MKVFSFFGIIICFGASAEEELFVRLIAKGDTFLWRMFRPEGYTRRAEIIRLLDERVHLQKYPTRRRASVQRENDGESA